MPEWNRESTEPGDRRTLVYRGSSMYPTFRELDVLTVRNDRPLRIGDVVAFTSPDHPRITVHRVIGRTGSNLITQGDNSRLPDEHPVSQEAILGRIDSANRDGSVLSVRGGGMGLAYGTACHLFSRFRPLVFGIMGPVYRRLVAR